MCSSAEERNDLSDINTTVMKERDQVIENIRLAVREGRYNDKVEVGDPVLSEQEVRHLLYKFLTHKESPVYGTGNFIANRIADMATWHINRETRIFGLEKLLAVKHRSAIITSNHFSPVDNTILRHLLAHEGLGKLLVISQDTNFAMRGLTGFLLKYIDAIPISHDQGYMASFFFEQLDEAVRQNRWILMYPEAEMWYNYRKPRPCRKGAYFYAHKLGVPVISCFVKIDDERTDPQLGPDKLRYALYVLALIYPDASMSCKEDSERMRDLDYRLKVAAYESVYGKALDYTFESWDIAGLKEEA